MKMKALSLAVATAASLMSAAHAAEVTKTVTMSSNLYYTGMAPLLSTDQNSFIPPFGYPTTPLAFEDYRNTNIFDCPRDVVPEYVEGDEVQNGTNTATDARRSCFGSEPVVLTLSEAGVAAGGTLHLSVSGTIDPDTPNDYRAPGASGIPRVDARGQLGSGESNPENGFDYYSLIGVWASDAPASLEGHNDSVGTTNRYDLLTDYGFTAIGEEFVVTDDLAAADGYDETTVGSIYEFKGSVTVPAGATHLILGYNANKGGFYHHGDPAYTGTTNPLWDALADNTTRAGFGLVTDRVVPLEEGSYTFEGTAVNAVAGDEKAVGVFQVIASDGAVTSTVTLSKPDAKYSYTTDGLTASFNASTTVIDATDTIKTYSWTFGDGQTVSTTTPTVSHTYEMAGGYQVTLTVTNSIGIVDSETKAITVDSTNRTGDSDAGDTTKSASSGGGGGAFGLGLLGLGLLGLRRRKA